MEKLTTVVLMLNMYVQVFPEKLLSLQIPTSPGCMQYFCYLLVSDEKVQARHDVFMASQITPWMGEDQRKANYNTDVECPLGYKEVFFPHHRLSTVCPTVCLAQESS